MILCSKLKNGFWKKVTKSQVSLNLMSLNRNCTVYEHFYKQLGNSKTKLTPFLNVYTQLQSQCLFRHFLFVWQVQILTVYAHWVRQRKNSHFTLLKTVKELDNFSYCQVTAQWMILCFLSKQTKVNSDGGGYKKVLKKEMNTV